MRKQLLFKAPIRGVSGYATYSRELLKAFTKKYGDDYAVQAWSYPWQEYDIPLGDTQEEALVQEWMANKVNKKEAILLNWTLPHEFLPDCKYNIGYSLFETDRIPELWRIHCDKMHEMWIPSTFNYRTFRDGGVAISMYVVPGGVEDFYFNDIPPMNIPEITTKFNFFTGGQWIPGENDRKNFGKVIHAFCDQFRNNPDVGLIAKVYTHNNNTIDYYNTSSRIDEIKKRMGVGQYPKIYLVHGSLTKEQILGLIRRADCAVLPSPEGWGMWHIQCAAAGLPVIAYDWSSYTDFLNPELTPYVKHGNMVQVSKEMQHLEPYREYQCWPELDIVALKKKMLEVNKDVISWKDKAKEQQTNLYNNWRWEHAADIMFNRLEKISQQIGTGRVYSISKYEKNLDKSIPDVPIYLGVVLHNNKKAFTQFLTRLEDMYRNVNEKKFPKLIYIIDNGSKKSERIDESLINNSILKNYIIFDRYDTVKSFSTVFNQIWEYTDIESGDTRYHMLFMDVNTYITDYEFMSHMSNVIDCNDDVGCVGCKINSMNNGIYSAGTYITTHSLTGINLGGKEPDTEYFHQIYPVQGVSGLCMMYWGGLLKEVGGFDTEYFSAYKNTALQMTLQDVGYKIIMDGLTEIAYDEELSKVQVEFDIQKVVQSDKAVFESKWFFHPLLTDWETTNGFGRS